MKKMGFLDDINEKRASVASTELTASPAPPALQLSELEANDQRVQPSRTRAYFSVFGAFLALFCTFGDINSFGTFQAWYLSHQLQSMSPSAISWIGSIQLFVFFLLVSNMTITYLARSIIGSPYHGSFSSVLGSADWAGIRRHRTEVLDDHRNSGLHNIHHASFHFSQLHGISHRTRNTL